jgi:hypothetical protein
LSGEWGEDLLALELRFLVVSAPPGHGDRIDVAPIDAC